MWLTKKKEGRGKWKRGLWCRSEQINGPGEFLVVCTGERDYLPSYPLCVRACMRACVRAPSARRSCVNQK